MNAHIKIKLKKTTQLISGLYFILSVLWIFGSDELIQSYFSSVDSFIFIEKFKGTFFVFITSVLLYLIISRKDRFITDLVDRLKDQEQHLIDTFEHSAVGIVHTSVDERILLANHTFCDMLGYEGDQLLSLNLKDILHKDDLCLAREQDEKIKKKEINSYIIELKFISQNNEICYSRLTKSGVRDKAGNLMYFISLVEGLSDQKASELKQLALKKTQEKLLAEVHHRVKNNLAIISGLLELQMQNSEDSCLEKTLQQQVVRIKTMAFIYEAHYEDEYLEYVDFLNYLNKFVVFVTNRFPEVAVTLTSPIPNLSLNINQAMPCALILGELFIHNCLYDTEINKVINIELNKVGDKVLLKVNGDCLPLDNDPFRYTILKTLSKQLNSSFEFVEKTESSQYKFIFQQLSEVKGAYDSRSLYVDPI